jgi:osmotically-inducible protein OsmY
MTNEDAPNKHREALGPTEEEDEAGGGGGGQHGGMVEGIHHHRVRATDYTHAGAGETNRSHEHYGYVESKGTPGADDYRGPERDYPALRPRRDEEIVKEIKDHFVDDALLNSQDIEVRSNGGRVILTGIVDDEDVIDHVTELCRHVEGVNEVDNRLELG